MITRETEEQISAYADGRLRGDERDFIARLLESDPDAQAFYSEILDLRGQFAALPRFSLGSDFTQSVMDRIDAGDFTPRTLASTAHFRPLLERLARPRIWIYPLSVLVVALLIVPLISNESSRSKAPAVARQTSVSEPLASSVPSDDSSDAAAAPKVKPLEPIRLTPAEREELRTPPRPLAEGPTPPERRIVEAVPVVLKPAEAERFPFLLQKIAAEIGIERLNERRVGDTAVFEMFVTSEQAAALAERLGALDVFAQPVAFPAAAAEKDAPFSLQLEIAVAR